MLRKLSKNLHGQHKALEYLCKKFNSPVIGLKLGTEFVIYARSYEIVKEIHSREEFDGRPDNFFLRLRTMGTRLGITCTGNKQSNNRVSECEALTFYSDGKHWSEQRSFCVRQLKNIGYGKSRMEKEIQNSVSELLEYLESQKSNSLWPGENFLSQSILSVLWTFCSGKRMARNDERILKLIDLLYKRSKLFDMAGGILSQFPILRFIAPEFSGYSLIQNLNQQFYDFFMEIINEHIDTFDEKKSNDDLIYSFLNEMKLRKSEKPSSFHLKQLIMVILDIFIAGSQTTSTTIDLALMMMTLRPDLKKKCLNEISNNASEDELDCYSEKLKFPYIRAFLLEVQRYFHIVPVSGPRRVLKQCELAGYQIPLNTTVLIGLQSVHMDKNYWRNPEEFCPERFLDESTTNYSIKNFERILTFGGGRRKCLGDQLAKSCIFSFFVNILKHFELEPDLKFPASLELQPGITLSPQQYKIKFMKRKIA